MEKSRNSQTMNSQNKQLPTKSDNQNKKTLIERQKTNETPQISTSNNQPIDENSISSSIKEEFIPRKDVEFAFTCLSNWESSYDGVHRIWELIKNEPDIDLDDYFDSLDFTQKCFLVSGLYSNMQDDKMENLTPIIDRLDQRMTNETKSDRVQREAQRVGEKMSELIKTETPKINRIKENSSGTILRSPSSSTSSKLTTTPREIRSSRSMVNESSNSSKTQSKVSNLRTANNISKNSSVSSRSSKTSVISKSESTAPPNAFGFSLRRSTNKTSTPTSSINDANSTSNYTYGSNLSNRNQNSITPKTRITKNTNQRNDLASPISSSLYNRTPNSSTSQTHKSKL